jgi:murein DD-endopeptidase MepM/ murein hydrolase activator NlpD
VVALLGYVFISWLVQESQLAESQRLIDELAQTNEALSQKSENDERLFTTASREIEEKYRQLQAIAVRNGLIREKKGTPQRFGGGPGQPAAPESSGASSLLDNSSLETMDGGKAGALPGQPEADAAARLRASELKYAELESALRLTKLDIGALLAQQTKSTRPTEQRGWPRWNFGRGGPQIDMPDAIHPGNPGVQLIAFDAETARASAVRHLAKRLPLDPPMAEGWISSDFGPRRDPVTGRKAFHPGLDIGGPYRSIIYATGPGVVTFAGTEGAYGRMVEVTHDFGLKTRYGHLSKIRVKNGDQVLKGQAVGVMGSTGRSTGPHLHYEVIHNDQPFDPSNLLEAGYHVQRQQTITASAH